jgi:Rha family phage regulatory protein
MAKKNLQKVPPITLVVEHDRPMASSLQVAKHFAKRHDSVLRAIRNAIAEIPEDFRSRNFVETEETVVVPASGGIRKDPAYMLTRDGFAYICMGFTGRRAAKWKVKYIEAFNRMEARLRRTALDEYPWPPREDDETRHGRMRKLLRAMLAMWGNLDNIPIENAAMALNLHLGVSRLEDFHPDDFGKAVDYLSRARSLPFAVGDKATDQQLECIRFIAEGCSQFRAFRDGDLHSLSKRPSRKNCKSASR